MYNDERKYAYKTFQDGTVCAERLFVLRSPSFPPPAERFAVLQSGVGGTAFHIAQSRIYKIDMKSNGEICNCMFRCRCVHYIICCRFMLYLKQGILAYGKNIKKIGTADIRAETYKSAPELHAF